MMAFPDDFNQILDTPEPQNEISPDIETPPEAPLMIPPPAGVVRRVLAFIIDILILGVIVFLISYLLGNVISLFGPFSRLIGIAIALAYFGIFNSSFLLLDGKTPGKRVMHLSVVNAKGEPISLRLSLLRSLILVLILINIPLLNKYVWFNALLFGLGVAMAYLLLFNRPSHQMLDDLLAGTYVVHDEGSSIQSFPITPRSQKIAAGVVVIVLSLVLWGTQQLLLNNPGTSAIASKFQPLLQPLAQDRRFISAQVGEQSQQATGQQPKKYLVITLELSRDPGDLQRTQISQEVAQLANSSLPTSDYDAVVVQMASGYDLGLSGGATTWVYVPPGEALQMVKTYKLGLFSFYQKYSYNP
jgi:uncharacterized RDD family membrane protein YckC